MATAIHAGEQGGAKCGTSGLRAGNDEPRVSPPVRSAYPKHPFEVRENVDDQQHAPREEAERVHGAQYSAAVPDGDQRNSASEERQR